MLKKLRRRLTVIFTSLTGLVLGVALVTGYMFAYSQQTEKAYLEHGVAMYQLMSYLSAAENPDPAWLTRFEQQEGFVLNIYMYNQASPEWSEFEFPYGTVTRTPRAELFEKARSMDFAVSIVSSADASESASGAVMPGALEYYVAQPAEGVWKDTVSSDSNGTIQQNSYRSILQENAFEGDAVAVNIGVHEANNSMRGSGGDIFRVSGFIYPGLYNSYDVVALQDLAGERWDVFMLTLLYVGLFLVGMLLLWLVSRRLAAIVLRTTEEGMQKQADFIAAASHELKSPLAVVQSSLSAADVAPTLEQAEKYRTNAAAEAARMGRLVDDLLLLAGGDAGTWHMQHAPVDVDTLVINAGEDFALLAKTKKIKLEVVLPEETLPTVRGDMDRLRQVLAVLLDNALHYAPEGSRVCIKARARKGHVEIDVEDNGGGIPDDSKEKVFDRFYRADKSRTDKSHFGLGLAVAKELAELHKGSLTVLDTPGGGATFRLSLPE